MGPVSRMHAAGPPGPAGGSGSDGAGRAADVLHGGAFAHGPSRQAVLVTGGAGYIGSHAVRALRRAGYPVTVLDDLSSGRREAVPGDVAFVRADIGDGRVVGAALAEHRIGAVMHLAALVGVAESVAAPQACDRINRAATATLVRAAVERGVRRFVFASSAAVYGVPLAVPVGEDAPLVPITPYGASKAAAERVLRAAARGREFRFVALRMFNVAGAGLGTVAAGRVRSASRPRRLRTPGGFGQRGRGSGSSRRTRARGASAIATRTRDGADSATGGAVTMRRIDEPHPMPRAGGFVA